MNVSEELIRSIVEKVIAEAACSSSKCGFEKQVDPSGVIGVICAVMGRGKKAHAA